MTQTPDGPVKGRPSWDLFCRVVDNFGDIGIAWRLARQLAADPARSVRLVVDDLDAFARIEPRVAPGVDSQAIDGIAIRSWTGVETSGARFDPATVVVELLGCGLPPNVLEAMAAHAPLASPVWIDFEHLSAEAWVTDFHGLPSPHPRLPLVKHFFYPGFGSRTGGLLLEPGLAARRGAFLGQAATTAFWRRFDMEPPAVGEMRVLVFAYPCAPLPALLDAMATDPDRRWSVVIPDATSTKTVDRRGSLCVQTIPFVDQDTFDELLRSCDLAFVRGEDSFVRAQAAGRPFVWQIYPQAGAAHLTKLAAFEALYEADLSPSAAAASRAWWAAWNGDGRDVGAAWRGWLDVLPELRIRADAWRSDLAADTPSIHRLVAFVAGIDATQRALSVC